MDNTCVCCGTLIPEGRMVCPTCEAPLKLEDTNRCASLNYEAEYERTIAELIKQQDENCFLRGELANKERELSWHYGFREAVELILRGKNNG